ncbi:MAG: phosphatidate cytidylyltransferase [Saprospiraceae bacterium]|nr:phosphatidate cytidylyltransferase [Saprospiraceae bacterium]
MKQRTITAVFFAVAMIGGIYGGVWPFFTLFLVIAAGSLWEFLGLMLPREQSDFGFKRLIGTKMGLLAILLFVCYRFPDQFGTQRLQPLLSDWPFLLTFFVGSALLVELFGTSKAPFQNIGYYAAGTFYIALPVAMLYDVASLSDYHPHRVMGIFWIIWTNDTMAYLIGSQIGRRKLFERISPKKTWEGTIGGAICTVLMAWAISLYSNDFTTAQWLAVGAMVGIFGTLGDLVESMLKRSIGVKDSGTLLPGHGGLLDRFDSFLFVVGFVWVVVRVF